MTSVARLAMAATANKLAGIELDPLLLEAEADAAGKGLMEHWALTAQTTKQPIATQLAAYALRLVQSRASWKEVVKEALARLPTTASANADSNEGTLSDAEEDKTAWETATRAIRAEKGGDLELAELLQGIALRPKEPPADPNAVALLTVHGAKGLEFDFVWVIGLAESVLPSWQSLKPGAPPTELEEERRNCFVAITRTQRTLVLTRANKYRGWAKDASRFLSEMGLSQ